MLRLPKTVLLGLALCWAIPHAAATDIPLGAASDYVILFSSNTGKKLEIDDATIGDPNNAVILGNIGIGGSGKFKENNNNSTITGRLDFQAANTGQFDSSSGSGPTTVSYNQNSANLDPLAHEVDTAISEATNLSSTLGALAGTNIAINGPMTIDAADGALIGGYRVFNVTSYTFGDNEQFVINADPADPGRPVVFNFGFNSDINFKGLMTLNGLTPDQVLFNVTNSGKNVNLADKASFLGTILAPGAAQLEMGKATLVGRFFGSFSGTTDAKIASEAMISAYDANGPANGTPEPSSIALLAVALAGLAAMRRRQPSQPQLAPIG